MIYNLFITKPIDRSDILISRGVDLEKRTATSGSNTNTKNIKSSYI